MTDRTVVYEFGEFRLDPVARAFTRQDQPIALAPKSFDLLMLLVERRGRVLERGELIRELWPDTIVEEANLTFQVSTVRKALGEAGSRWIETVPKHGYRFTAPVRELRPEDTRDREALSMPPASRVRLGPPMWRRSATGLALVALVAAFASIVFGLSHLGCPPWRTNIEARVVPVTSFSGSESHAAFSPGRNQIAFVWNGAREDNSDIYVKFVDSGEPLRLTSNPAPDFNPVWSPDGRQIAYTREGEARGIYLVPALGGAERKLADLWSEHPFRLRLSYSADGKYLAVADKRSAAEPWSIFLLDMETGEQRQLTRPPRGSSGDESPSFSPNGRSLAFARLLGGTKHLYVVPTEGGEPSRVNIDNQPSRGSFTDGLAWRPDGREIVFSSNREGSFHLWRVPISGGAPRRVEVFAQGLAHPAISPRGDRLAWTHTSVDTNIWRVEVARAEGQKAEPVQLIASTMGDSNPQISEDGRIVFASSRSGHTEIWVADREGKNPVRLTHTNGNIGTPRWSPDGRQIAFDGILTGNRNIYVINSTGGKPRPVTTEPSEECCPSWSRDGQWIYFGSDRSGSLQISKVRSTGGPAEQLTKQGGFEGFEVESSEGTYFYYAKGRDIPGIWRIPVGGSEETPVLDHHGAGYWRSWAVTEQGIYFATAETPNRPILEFFNFATRQVTPVTTLDKRISSRVWGLSVSPDRQWILYTQIDHQNSDIMLMENFR